MKKTISIFMILLFVGSSVIIAQNLAVQRKVNQFTEYIDRHNTNEIYDINDPDTYNGTPFQYTAYLLGNIYQNNELVQRNIPLRYNAYADEIEYKESMSIDDSLAKAIIKSQDIYVTINDEALIFIPEKGYFLALYDGTNFSFLKKIIKKYYMPKESTNTYDKGSPPTFADRSTYFIYTKEGTIHEFPNSKKKKLAVFGNCSKDAEKYLKENKLNLNEEEDLKKVIMHLDGLKDVSL